MKKILTIGEILVEMVATEINQKFNETGVFTGPFPSGAPAIFADQAARIGSKVSIISAVGNDGFGELNLSRLKENNVETDHIKVLDDIPTGSAFVTYEDTGSRDFIFNISNSAAGDIDESYINESLFEDVSFFHIMGSAVYSDGVRRAIEKSLNIIRDTDIEITFDPNVRKEILDDSLKLEFLQEILKISDIILAGNDELEYLMGNDNVEDNVNTILNDYKARIVLVKYGEKGSELYMHNFYQKIEPYIVEERDPTGAGDCFAGTFVSCINRGMSEITSAKYASVAGALAVTKIGPMEGNSSIREIQAFLDEQK